MICKQSKQQSVTMRPHTLWLDELIFTCLYGLSIYFINEATTIFMESRRLEI